MSNENREQSLDKEQAADLTRQLLRSFRMSGLETLPKPSGRYDFGFATSPAAAAPLKTEPVSSPKQPAANQQAATSGSAQHVSIAGVDKVAAFGSQTTNTGLLDHYESESIGVEARRQQLHLLATEVSQCTRCNELASCRKNTVFGIGSGQPQLCFLGEGPGADEDRQGEPFVGAAGQLLNRIIEACKMKREEVYILNTVKCRPPGNRNPNEQELDNCWPYAIQQLEILQPQFICCLGSVAARTLLQTKQSIGKLRGQFFQFRGSKVLVTYHPAYLLRNPSAKRQVWDDMKILLAAMGRSI